MAMSNEDVKAKIQEWINSGKTFELIIESRKKVDQNWFNQTALCELLSEDVFFAIKPESNVIWKCHDFVDEFIFTSDFKDSLTRLTESLIIKLESLEHSWQWPQNICILLQCILELEPINYEKRIDDLDDNIIDLIIEYFHKLLSQCNDLKTVMLVVSVLIKFSKSKIHKLIKLATNAISPEQDGTNFCRFIDALAKRRSEILQNESTVDFIFKYLITVLNEYSMHIESSHLQTLFMAILSVENLLIRNICKKPKQIEKLANSKFLEKFKALPDFESGSNYLLYQIQFCGNWLFFKQIAFLNGSIENIPVLKISNDQLSARNDNLRFGFPTVLSTFATKRNVFYYEVLLLTDGEMRFGWSTEQAKWDQNNAIGNDSYAIGLDVSQMFLYHNSIMNKGKPYFLEQNQLSTSAETSHTKGKVGDIVGCLIDVNQKQFSFFLNGFEIKFDEIKVKFDDSGAYYAATSLAENQHCIFNFGNTKFKYPPKDVKYLDIFNFVHGDIRKYGLMSTKETDGQFWFENPVYNDQIIPFYLTPGELVPKLDIEGKLIINIDELDDENKCLRTIREIIEHLEMDTEKIEETAASISLLFAHIETKITKAKLYQLFYSYLIMNVDQNDAQKHLKIGIFLVNMIEIFETIHPIRVQVFVYLLKIFTNINDSWTELHALIGLMHLELTNYEIMALNQSEKLQNLSQKFYQFEIHEKIEEEDFKRNSSIVYQVLFSCHFLMEGKLKAIQDNSDPQINKVALNDKDRTQHLKLSHDQFCARSDSQWQSVRSVYKVEKDIFYYEVTLITGGAMRIGWSAKRIDSNIIGTKDHFSVAFDGFNECLWHEGEKYLLGENAQWKAGDTVGCLIDKEQKRFIFTLNGQQLDLPENIHFCNLPYGAAISLSHRQQVHYNFGQRQFKHTVKRIDYRNFYDLVEEAKAAEELLKSTTVYVNGNVSYSTIDVHSKREEIRNNNQLVTQLNHSSRLNPFPESVNNRLQSSHIDSSAINSNNAEFKMCHFCRKRVCEEWIVCCDCSQKHCTPSDECSLHPNAEGKNDQPQIEKNNSNNSEESD